MTIAQTKAVARKRRQTRKKVKPMPTRESFAAAKGGKAGKRK